ncbi:SAM-dependent methyltransferase [Algihabitans albus]|uniref:SAM-dependent methyltransferase n=1 Tax=Algihabitans albus TaxID=2164067 RepID=UPI001F3AF0A9|nr:cyclopropane-fatty-acyl-phospholipid synthase family protein [Algihabitans albus]
MTDLTQELQETAHLPRPYGVLGFFGRRLACGSATLLLPDGSRYLYRGSEPGPHGELQVLNPRAVRRLISGGSTGFAEAYMAGDVDSPDLAAFLRVAALNFEAWEERLEGSATYRMMKRFWHLMRPNSRSGAQRNIAFHYDLGNAFYGAWLDETMTYSSAVFEHEAMDLSAAQRVKYRRIAEAADLSPDHHLLEIGCGWGGFAEFAAKEIGARVTAVTISNQQFAFARRRIQEAGLTDRVEIRLQDYRDIPDRFDRIASIEMFEAVGEKYWPAYFAKVQESLRPGGRAALQVITIADGFFERYRRGADFIQRYIFPGGMLPSPSVLRQEITTAGLRWVDDHGYGRHYERTLADWHERFDAAWPQLTTLGFDSYFQRMWKYYLAYCEAGFATGRIDVRQLTLARE